MGRRNFLIEGGSGTGKTSVCDELARRGHQAIHGDRELAYQGHPTTGEPVNVTGLAVHDHHIWRVDLVRALIADQQEPMTFFCGGSRNFATFVHRFDGVFVLELDAATLVRRLDERPEDEWGGRSQQEARELILRLHRTQQDVPHNGVAIDATAPLAQVVDEIVARSEAIKALPNEST
jgi:thymidylate kinase